MKEFTLPVVKPLHWAWKTLGFTLFPVMLFFYSFFFERELIYYRIAIYRYLKENGVPTPTKSILGHNKFDLGEIEITDTDYKWFAFRKNSLDCLQCSFNGDPFLSYYYNKIHKMLKEAQK